MTSDTSTQAAPTPTLAPTPKQIDALILEHTAAQAYLQSGGKIEKLPGESAAGIAMRLKAHLLAEVEFKKSASEVANEVKARLTAMVETWGVRHSEKTMRIEGIHNIAKNTTGTRVVVDGDAVENVKIYLDALEMPDLVEKFFTQHISYSMVKGPAAVLKTLTLAARIRARLTKLLKLTSDVVTNAPYLTIEAVAPAKPATTANPGSPASELAGRGGKAA
jgi:hypothetical protein